MKALDASTLQITLTEPNAIFLHFLTMPFASAVPKEAVEKYGKDFGQHPVGTGAFKMERLLANQVVWVNPSVPIERVSSGR